jgi:ankyrin repeat protein
LYDLKTSNFDRNLFKYSTLLCLASKVGNLSLVQLLLKHGSDPNQVNEWQHISDDEISPIFIAMQYRHLNIVYELLNDTRLDIHAIGKLGQSILVIAIFENNFELVCLIIEKGANINTDIQIANVLINPLSFSFHKIQESIQENNIDFSDYTSNPEFLIFNALLSAGADPNKISYGIIKFLFESTIIPPSQFVKHKDVILFFIHIIKILLIYGFDIDLYNDFIGCGYEARNSKFCACLYKTIKKAKYRCTGCNFMVYCCKKHQQMDYLNHKDFCTILKISD